MERVVENIKGPLSQEFGLVLNKIRLGMSVEEALNDPHFKARGVFGRQLSADGKSIVALPVPVADAFRSTQTDAGYPALGQDNGLLKSK